MFNYIILGLPITIGEDLMSALQTVLATPEMTSGYVSAVVITGLVVVFACLVILVLFLYIMGFIFNRDKRSGKKNVAAVTDKPVSPEIKPVKANSSTKAVQGGISNEIVAAISAAIAMIGEKTGKKLKIKGIKRASRQGSNSWANAGKVDNTRPF